MCRTLSKVFLCVSTRSSLHLLSSRLYNNFPTDLHLCGPPINFLHTSREILSKQESDHATPQRLSGSYLMPNKHKTCTVVTESLTASQISLPFFLHCSHPGFWQAHSCLRVFAHAVPSAGTGPTLPIPPLPLPPCLCSNISPSAGLLFPSLSAKNIPFVLSISSLFSSEHFHHRPYYIFTLCDCVSAPYNAKPMKIGIFNLYPEHIRQ